MELILRSSLACECSEESFNLSSVRVQIHVIEAGPRWQARHFRNVTTNWHNESSSSRDENVIDNDLKANRCTFDGWISSQRI